MPDQGSGGAGGQARLSVRPPFDVERALAAVHAHAVPGIEEVDVAAGTVRRLLPVDGAMGPVTVSLGADRIDLHTAASPVSDDLRLRIRRWFDLDLDPAAVAEHFAADPHVGPSVRARPGLRVIGHPAGFEAAIGTVLGQHVSLAAARTFAGRLVEAFGCSGPGGLRTFPTPEALARLPADRLQSAVGVTGARARTVSAVARACADGLDIDPGGDHHDIRRRLREIPGIGSWTVEYLAVRALGDRDAFPAGDLVLRRALGGVTAARAESLSQAWRPCRAYALVHLWSMVWPRQTDDPARRTP